MGQEVGLPRESEVLMRTWITIYKTDGTMSKIAFARTVEACDDWVKFSRDDADEYHVFNIRHIISYFISREEG